ncbi:Scr1 family TA system antitoxin-like transcriptional regulator [Streptomyces sp. NPDC093223]|uniref:helix-turn-helix domain-containing protein n=1 Tax=Streptomyces sp. NPDC093223 TaxID=3366033 RepID=UPI0038168719
MPDACHRHLSQRGPVAVTTNAEFFGELLRHYREEALLTQEALARQIPCDRSLVARVEAGTRVPSDSFAKKCDEVLRTGGVLMRLWGRVDWYPQVEHPDWFGRWVEMEAKAAAMYQYQTMVVPGLLQTPDYARALLSRRASGELLEKRVRARLARQPRYLAEGGPMFVAVLDESCLRQAVGNPAVMRDQCAHLLSAGQLPNIRIQMVPASRFDLARPNRPVSLVTMPDGERWIYTESLSHGYFNNEPEACAEQGRIYDVLRADTLSARESASMIGQLMKEYGDHDPASARRGDDLDQEQLQRRRRGSMPRIRPRVHLRRPRP